MRIMSNQPQAHFTRKQLIMVKPDTTVAGKRIGDMYVYRQGDDYMIIEGLAEATYLERMGFVVEIQK